ncbi:hypothetical protein A0H81_10855 [Grifola frondosa]|uniref:Uncharacterized protein n=1 Tax=Grifola frondosa TaxID=5627 RepID=A0A1C7LX44_GRIFR|nr:hypothetical protein A0H81_10855 [Grifola frondosa]
MAGFVEQAEWEARGILYRDKESSWEQILGGMRFKIEAKSSEYYMHLEDDEILTLEEFEQSNIHES